MKRLQAGRKRESRNNVGAVIGPSSRQPPSRHVTTRLHVQLTWVAYSPREPDGFTVQTTHADFPCSLSLVIRLSSFEQRFCRGIVTRNAARRHCNRPKRREILRISVFRRSRRLAGTNHHVREAFRFRCGPPTATHRIDCSRR